MDMKGKSVAVIGGGIGGMAAAVALTRIGARVRVYEQAPELGEVGAGLQISVNGQRALRALGVVDAEMPDGATLSAGTDMIDGRSGRVVARIPAPRGGPTWYMHRADLLELLRRRAVSWGVEVSLGVVKGPGTIEADLVVAADGVRSLWRSEVDGPQVPRFTGQVAWRALVPWSGDMPDGARLVMGHRAHLVAYPLREGRLMNLVAVEERQDWTDEGWMQTGDAAQFRARFADFHGSVRGVVDRVDAVHIWALHARPVARRWVKKNIVLLGDAAHPTLPFMAQGACLALEDAVVLARRLEVAPVLSAGLQAFEEARRARAARVVGLARGNGWRFHLGWPLSIGANLVLNLGSDVLARRLEWLYDYDPAAQ